MGKNGRVQGQGSGKTHGVGYIGDRKLIPRIKEYIKENDGHMLEADEVATALQAEYSEYSRKKKAAFRNCVAKALKLVSGGSVPVEEGRLQRLERRHLDTQWRRKRDGRKNEGVPDVGDGKEGEEELGSEEDSMADMDFETHDDHNMMNNSLLQVYHENSSIPAPLVGSDVPADVPTTHTCGSGSPLHDRFDSTVPSSQDTQGDVASPGGPGGRQFPPVLYGETGVPVGTIDTSVESTFLSHVTTSDSHVTASDSHVTASDGHVNHHATSGDGQVTGSDGQRATQQHVSVGGCGSGEDSRREGTVGATPEGRRRVRKVTFAPDVVDKQDITTVKSVCASRKRRHVIGEEDEMTLRHKKHRSHHEHRTHHTKHRAQEKKSGERRGERGERGDGGGEGDSTSQHKLKEKHIKSHFVVEQSSVTFGDVGGCQVAIKEVQKLLLHLRHPEIFTRLGIRPPQGFLLHGPPGCGKTLLANAIAGETGLPLIRLSATEIVSGVSGESESTLRELFTLAKGSVPCVLFIDEVDAICPKRETTQREMEKRIVSQLLACVDDLHGSEEGSKVLLIAATTQPDSLDPAIRRSGRFDREICLGIPDEAARLSILQVLTRGLRLESNFPFSDIAHHTPGYVGADLKALVREASLSAVDRLLSQATPSGTVGGAASEVGSREPMEPTPPSENFTTSSQPGGHLADQFLDTMFITAQDFQQALQEVQPSAKREGFATVPDTTWDDVGALEDVREELSLAILAPVRYPQQFTSLGLTTPPGILLVGPPGCGKTLLAKAVANESGINFISVKGPELLNMYVGESERAVRQVFQRARNSAPCVIFFDELDALCPKRSEMAETSASARVVNQLLTEMDGLQARSQVFIMAATNRPDIIDPAMLRPGRLDKQLYIGLPQAADRSTILNTITKNGTQPQLDSSVDLSVLASPSHTAGFSGADLKALVREASIAALKEYMKLESSHWVASNESGRGMHSSPGATEVDVSGCSLAMHHFLSALSRVKPSVSEEDWVFYEKIKERFCK